VGATRGAQVSWGSASSNDGKRAAPSRPKALEKFKAQIRDMNPPGHGGSGLQQAARRPQAIPHSGMGAVYFGFLPDPTCCLRTWKAWISPKDYARIFGGSGTTGHKPLQTNCAVVGVSKFRAAVAAGSPTGLLAHVQDTPAVQQALRKPLLSTSLGLPRLYVPAPSLTPIEPPVVRNPYGPVGVGGVGHREVSPLSRSLPQKADSPECRNLRVAIVQQLCNLDRLVRAQESRFVCLPDQDA